jgi:hypothetical protein
MKKRLLRVLLAFVTVGIGIYYTTSILHSKREKHRSWISIHTCVEIRNLLTKGVTSDEFRSQIDSIPRLRPTIGTLIYDLADGSVMVSFPDDRNQDIDRWSIAKNDNSKE